MRQLMEWEIQTRNVSQSSIHDTFHRPRLSSLIATAPPEDFCMEQLEILATTNSLDQSDWEMEQGE
jgi:hypothetical protein